MTDSKDIPTSPLQGKKVLIIEDDVFLGSILLHHMLDQKILARLFTTGDNAIEAIKEDVPDIIILDILLPGVNGLDLLEQIRQDPAIAKVPILVVSNTDQPSDRQKAKVLGARFMLKALATPANIVEQMMELLAAAV